MTPQELEELGKKLWEGVEDSRFVDKDQVPQVTSQQLDEIISCIKDNNLICDIRSAGFFGSIGLLIIEGPAFPGTESKSVVFLTQYHLPRKHYPQSHQPTMGNPPDDAWALFASLALSDGNLARMKWAGLKPPAGNKSHYAY